MSKNTEVGRYDSPGNERANLAGGGRDAVACGADVGGEHLTRQQPCGGVGPKLACSTCTHASANKPA